MQMNIEKREHGYHIFHADEDGRSVSRGTILRYGLHLNGAELKAFGIGGVGTDPEYRRMGLVRQFLAKAFALAEEEGCAATVLHPFSFAYYRKFGFERVADHRILEFPVRALDFVPRYEKFKRCSSADAAELNTVYNTFAAGRNIIFARSNGYGWPLEHISQKVYLSRDESGAADAYIIFETETPLYVNHIANAVLHVREFGFTTPAALDKLLGFMRMFDGQVETVILHNTAMAPEVELRLRHYTHTKITIVPDLMVRIHDVEAVLKAVRYPVAAGRFTVRVTEPENTSHSAAKTTGVWLVTYENGTAQVTRLADDAVCDLEADIPAFTRLLFGYESYGADAARYMPGVVLHDDCADFFRAFPNRPCGLFEHF